MKIVRTIASWIAAQRVLLVALSALALVAWGCWWIYPPSAPLTVGLLVLLDLARKG